MILIFGGSMPKGTEEPRPDGWQEALEACAAVLKEAGLCPPSALPGVHPLTTDGFTFILEELEKLGVKIVSRSSNKSLYNRPLATGWFDLFEIIADNDSTVGYWLFSDRDGGHFARAGRKLPA